MKSYRSEIERLIPGLRQVARALVETHRPDVADDLVHEALDEALRSERVWAQEDLETRLFTRVISANRLRLRADVGERRTLPGGAGRHGESSPPRRSSQGGQAAGLNALPLSDREALLLVVLGRVSYVKAADILCVPASTLIARLAHAHDTLGATLWGGASYGAAPAGRSGPGGHLRLVKS